MCGEYLGEFFWVGFRIFVQDYKSLHVTVTIYATLVNTHTDKPTDFDRLYMKSSMPFTFTFTFGEDLRTVQR